MIIVHHKDSLFYLHGNGHFSNYMNEEKCNGKDSTDKLIAIKMEIFAASSWPRVKDLSSQLETRNKKHSNTKNAVEMERSAEKLEWYSTHHVTEYAQRWSKWVSKAMTYISIDSFGFNYKDRSSFQYTFLFIRFDRVYHELDMAVWIRRCERWMRLIELVLSNIYNRKCFFF